MHFPAEGIFILSLAPVMTSVRLVAREESPAGWQDIERRPVRGLMDDGLRFGGPSRGHDRRIRHGMRGRGATAASRSVCGARRATDRGRILRGRGVGDRDSTAERANRTGMGRL